MRRALLGKILSDPDTVLMKAHFMVSSPCPYCDKPLNIASHEEPDPPEPGNVSICSHCAGVCQFDPNMRLVRTTIEELIAAGYPGDEIEKKRSLVQQAKGMFLFGPGDGEGSA